MLITSDHLSQLNPQVKPLKVFISDNSLVGKTVYSNFKRKPSTIRAKKEKCCLSSSYGGVHLNLKEETSLANQTASYELLSATNFHPYLRLILDTYQSKSFQDFGLMYNVCLSVVSVLCVHRYVSTGTSNIFSNGKSSTKASFSSLKYSGIIGAFG